MMEVVLSDEEFELENQRELHEETVSALNQISEQSLVSAKLITDGMSRLNESVLKLEKKELKSGDVTVDMSGLVQSVELLRKDVQANTEALKNPPKREFKVIRNKMGFTDSLKEM